MQLMGWCVSTKLLSYGRTCSFIRFRYSIVLAVLSYKKKNPLKILFIFEIVRAMHFPFKSPGTYIFFPPWACLYILDPLLCCNLASPRVYFSACVILQECGRLSSLLETFSISAQVRKKNSSRQDLANLVAGMCKILPSKSVPSSTKC